MTDSTRRIAPRSAGAVADTRLLRAARTDPRPRRVDGLPRRPSPVPPPGRPPAPERAPAARTPRFEGNGPCRTMTFGRSTGGRRAAYGVGHRTDRQHTDHLGRRVDLPAGCWAAAEPGTLSTRRSVPLVRRLILWRREAPAPQPGLRGSPSNVRFAAVTVGLDPGRRRERCQQLVRPADRAPTAAIAARGPGGPTSPSPRASKVRIRDALQPPLRRQVDLPRRAAVLDDLPLGRRQAVALPVDGPDARRPGDVQDLAHRRHPAGRAGDVVVELPDLVARRADQRVRLHSSHPQQYRVIVCAASPLGYY